MNNSQINNPLVSIIVVTYNSSEYVIETLESAKKQSYRNIELIITDDCSPDNTVEICRDWIEQNKERFVNAELISVEKNTGIAANCNRGIAKTKGEWIKLIAGDDLLCESCINDNLKFTNQHPNAKFITSKMQNINENGEMIDEEPMNFEAFRKYYYNLKHIRVYQYS
jgi:alpha-1,3-rhamnosyltransferase